MESTMKRLLLLFLTALALTASSPLSARAEETPTYSRVLDEETILYMDAALSVPWFTLPYSYYVRVISVGTTSVKVEYKCDSPLRPSVKGYVALSSLNLTDEIPSAPYPNVSFTVRETCLLYKDVAFTYTETVTENSTVDFYGVTVRPSGEKFLFGYVTVRSGDRYVGYLPVSAVSSFVVPRLPVEQKKESAVESLPEKTEKANDLLGDNLQIVIIVAVSVVAISVVYLLFRPSRNAARDEALSDARFDDE
ncbi:MAG: hypothetical protein SOT34_06505 [Candidatus Borkfalkiaceae bacterium]|nr:hypothetical protein [Christensenellaceae bacterium]